MELLDGAHAVRHGVLGRLLGLGEGSFERGRLRPGDQVANLQVFPGVFTGVFTGGYAQRRITGVVHARQEEWSEPWWGWW